MDEDTHNTINAPQAGATPPGTEPPHTARGRGGWGPLALMYVITAGAVIAGATLVPSWVAWVFLQMDVALDSTVNTWMWPGVSAASALIAVVLALPAVFLRRFGRIRAVGVAWIAAAVVMAFAGLTRLVPLPDGGLLLAVQALSTAVVAAVTWLVVRRIRRAPHEDADQAAAAPGAFWWAACAGGFTVLPWVWAGALGSVWDTVLAALAALALAALAAFVLGDRFWAAFQDVSGPVRVWAGGSAAGIALLMVGGAVGGGGVQWLTQIPLAALGFALAAVQRRGHRTGRVTAAAVAPAAFGPLAFTDSDEFLPLAFGMDFGRWLLIALAIAVGIAWLVGLVWALSSRALVSLPAVGAGLIVVLLGTVGAVNAFAQPGFHGEKMLVVLREQADLSGIDGDRDARLAEVHSRLTETAESTQGALREELDSWGVSWRPFYVVNAVEVDADPLTRGWLEKRDDVDSVLLSPQARPIPSPPEPSAGKALDDTDPQPNIDAIGAPEAWSAGDGSGITVGIADSGVDGEHPALADRFRGGDDSWADPVNDTARPTDPDGHGTHALGLAVGADGIGAAPGAEWMGCANLPRNFGNPADYLGCMQFMLAPYPQDGDPMSDGDPSRAPDIVTNSWGCPNIEGCDSRVLQPAIAAFSAAGVLFVAAAGNSGPECGSAATPPANSPDTYTVGAVNADNVVTDFSSRGDGELSKPDISAPGDEVVSALPGGGFGALSGTSMATPQVAGAAAALWSAQPDLVGDIAKTRELLNDNATEVEKAEGGKLRACGPSAAGAGVVNVNAAVEAAAR